MVKYLATSQDKSMDRQMLELMINFLKKKFHYLEVVGIEDSMSMYENN